MNVLNEFKYIKLEKNDEGVLTVELSRPEKLNAINLEMANEIITAIQDNAYSTNIRVLILKGSGKSFCSGYDVTSDMMRDMSAHEHWLKIHAVQRVFEVLAKAPVIRIAQLHGNVFGGGLLFARQCHLRYAASNTRFSIPELDMGTPFIFGGVGQLVRYVGLTRAADMIINCRVLLASELGANSLITEILSSDQLDNTVRQRAKEIARRPAALIIPTINALQDAEQRLVSDSADDLFTGFFAQNDPEVIDLNRKYVKRFRNNMD